MSARFTIVSRRPKIIETAVPVSLPRTPTVIFAISHIPLRILLYTMNNILIHFGNGAHVTAAYDIVADLVTECYRNLTQWWADGSVEGGLLPIDVIDEKVEEGFLADKGEVDFASEVDIFYDVDLSGGEFTTSVNIDPLNGGKGAKRGENRDVNSENINERRIRRYVQS